MDADALAAIGRDDIHRTVPPCCDLSPAHTLQNRRVVLGAAAQHKLVNRLAAYRIKIGGQVRLFVRNGKIVCQIGVGAIRSYAVPGGRRHRTAQ